MAIDEELRKETHRRASRAYYARNKKAHAARVKKWEARNRERVREIRRDSARRNPDSNRRRRHERRARERGVKIEKVEPSEVLARGGGLCGICGDPVDPANFHVDHIKPLAKGGEHSYANTQPSHPFCNQSKHDRELA